MMTGVIARAWKSVKPHIPLIKFRKGGSGPGSAGTATTVQAATAPSSAPRLPPNKAQQLPVIEDWQLPRRYRRSVLDDKEIDAINSGGAY